MLFAVASNRPPGIWLAGSADWRFFDFCAALAFARSRALALVMIFLPSQFVRLQQQFTEALHNITPDPA